MLHLHFLSLLAPLLYLFLPLFVQIATSSICASSSTSSLDFGSCSNPGITYGYGLDGSSQCGFAPANQSQFPHAFSPDVADVESYICARLENVCQASSAAVQACKNAFWRYSGLAGQNAVDAWNTALGVSNGSRPSSIGNGSAIECTVTTTTTTELVTSTATSLVSISLFITITSTVVSASSPPTSSLAVMASTSTARSTRTEVQTATVFVTSGPSTPASTSSSSSTTTTTSLTTAIAAQSSSKPAVDTNGSPFQDSARSLRLDRTNLALSLAILLAFVIC